jgi:hypothetical protein
MSLLLAALLVLPASAFGQTSSKGGAEVGPMVAPAREAREEARQRFDRGLKLYNEGDAIGALAEFQVAYKLTGHPMVLYNLALVHARLGHAAEAVEALERLRGAAPSELLPDAHERAKALYEEQLSRVGTLEVKSNAPGALIQIDNVDVARTPTLPIRLTAGPHLLAIFAAGHEPRHLKVTVAGRAHELLDVELEPLLQTPARVNITTHVPAVNVLVDGKLVGRTPLTNSLTLVAGAHELSLERDGYVQVKRSVVLEPGQTLELAVQMAPSAAGLRSGGTLKLALTEPGAVVSVDGEPRREVAGGIRLTRGLHTVHVQRAGFFDLVRQVDVQPGGRALNATLLPTPTYLADYLRRTQTQRTWSYIALGAGGLVSAASAGFLVWNQAQKSKAKESFDAYADEVEASPTGRCADDACQQTLQILTDDLTAKQDRDVYGWLGVGVGGLALTSGVLLYWWGDDPARYDTNPESNVFGSLGVGLGGRSVRLSGRF